MRCRFQWMRTRKALSRISDFPRRGDVRINDCVRSRIFAKRKKKKEKMCEWHFELPALTTGASILEVGRVKRSEVIVVKLPDDRFNRAQFWIPARSLCLVSFGVTDAVEIRVPAERDFLGEVLPVDHHSEVEITGYVVLVPWIYAIDLDHEAGGVVRHGQLVREDAQSCCEVFQSLVVARVQNYLRPRLGDDSQHVRYDTSK